MIGGGLFGSMVGWLVGWSNAGRGWRDIDGLCSKECLVFGFPFYRWFSCLGWVGFGCIRFHGIRCPGTDIYGCPV